MTTPRAEAESLLPINAKDQELQGALDACLAEMGPPLEPSIALIFGSIAQGLMYQDRDMNAAFNEWMN